MSNNFVGRYERDYKTNPAGHPYYTVTLMAVFDGTNE